MSPEAPPARSKRRRFNNGRQERWVISTGLVVLSLVGCGTASGGLKPRPDYKVSEAQYRAVKVGWTRAHAKRILGDPTGVITVPSYHRVCWDYPGVSRKGYEFCFVKGRLATKART